MAGLALALGALLAAAPAESQSATPRLQVEAHGGISLRDGFDGFRVGKDLRAAGVRLIRPREGLYPWLGVGRFEKPDLATDGTADETGWTVRGGVRIPFSRDPGEPGLHPELTAGLGAAFADEASFSYFFALGLAGRVLPRLTPWAALRWERVTDLNMTLFTAGLRLDL